MKKTLITSLIAILAFVAPTFAQVLPVQVSIPAKADLGASAQGSKETSTDIKNLEIKLPLTKKQKTEADLRSTSHRLSLVVGRTQTLIDLLTKKNKDTTDTQTALDKTNTSLIEANSAIDQFAGIVPLEIKIEDSADLLKQTDETTKPKEVVIFKDPLKKAQESLKSAKVSLLESITSLKNILIQKETGE